MFGASCFTVIWKWHLWSLIMLISGLKAFETCLELFYNNLKIVFWSLLILVSGQSFLNMFGSVLQSFEMALMVWIESLKKTPILYVYMKFIVSCVIWFTVTSLFSFCFIKRGKNVWFLKKKKKHSFCTDNVHENKKNLLCVQLYFIHC